MAKGDEKKLSQLFIKSLPKLSYIYRKLKLGEKVKILSDLTCLPENKTFKLGLGFTETDVCYYKKIRFKKYKNELEQSIKYIRDSKNDAEYLNIPIVIIELKSGDVTSDSIRARSMVAQRIKSVFPFCSYFFIGEKTHKTKETLIRQGKDFDSYFIYINSITKKEIKKIYRDFIRPTLDRFFRDWN